MVIPAFLDSSRYFYSLVLNTQGKIQYANQNFWTSLDFIDEHDNGPSFSDIFHPLDCRIFDEQVNQAILLRNTNFSIELRKLSTDGRDFIWTKWEFMIDHSNQNQSISGIGHIFKKTREIEIKLPHMLSDLHIQNELFNELLQTNLLGFWLWDIEDGNNQLSPSLLTILGNKFMEEFRVKGKEFWKQLVHQEDLEKVLQQIREHCQSQGRVPFHSEFRLLDNNGEAKWVLGFGKIVQRTSKGEATTMIGGIFDISEKKRLSDFLEAQNLFLEKLTFDQTHLMRARLANILGILEFIPSEQDSKNLNKYLKIIKSEAKKLDAVLKASINASSSIGEKDFQIREELLPTKSPYHSNGNE